MTKKRPMTPGMRRKILGYKRLEATLESVKWHAKRIINRKRRLKVLVKGTPVL